MRICYIQHESFEGIGAIGGWAAEKGYTVSGVHVYKGDPLPEVDAFDWLIVMGGSMGVYDEDRYPWLSKEKKFIEASIKADKLILGVCLGAQLLANVLGAPVRRNIVKEIGWFDVSLTPHGWNSPIFKGLPATFKAFHWHGDTFAIPESALHIASSMACANQAFVYGERVVGLQFHMESTRESIEAIVRGCQEELLEEGEFIQKADKLLGTETLFIELKKNLHALLDAMERQA
ncbi:type 1 glutamine amidotransferase [Dissulfurimicrobium hydrothermale]|uniref:type 1 glutamine amidotransferase n=1 Tax=Dissulfurimicrobium hydrothermale TaxID=1750598 RepID=UPI001EDB4A1D|nr:type 1 glutamine amidotransferase [Dissulfurimicrobium hydrothermale]UKL14299.1 type 1 glutamine amidotransferase [Dissulfurimicrobium hydrothermale]